MDQLLFIFLPTQNWTQPRSQGLSSYRSSLAPGGGMTDPGNEVEFDEEVEVAWNI